MIQATIPTGASGINVYRAGGPEGPFERLTALFFDPYIPAGQERVTIKDDCVRRGIRYWYKVRAAINNDAPYQEGPLTPALSGWRDDSTVGSPDSTRLL